MGAPRSGRSERVLRVIAVVSGFSDWWKGDLVEVNTSTSGGNATRACQLSASLH